jgi:hypothetical protein
MIASRTLDLTVSTNEGGGPVEQRGSTTIPRRTRRRPP